MNSNKPGHTSKMDFTSLANNWNNLASDKIDDCFYYDDNGVSNNEEPIWVRGSVVKLSGNIAAFKKRLAHYKEIRFYLGVHLDKTKDYFNFSPFVTVGEFDRITSSNSFALIWTDPMEVDSIRKTLIKAEKKSSRVPTRLVEFLLD